MAKLKVKCALFEDREIPGDKCHFKKWASEYSKNRYCQGCEYYAIVARLQNESEPLELSQQTENEENSTITKKQRRRNQSLLNNPLMEKTQMYDKTVPLSLEIDRERYEKDQNPIWLIHAFTDAVEHIKCGFKLDIPPWVIKKLDEVFQKYLYGVFEKEKDRSLDILMACKGRGRYSKAVEKFERRGRDVQLMTDMDMLIRQDMTPGDAAEVVYEHNRISPTSEKIRQMYYDKRYKWKAQLQKIKNYDDPMRIEALLKSAPEALRERYPDMKALQKKYPNIFGKTTVRLNKTLSKQHKRH